MKISIIKIYSFSLLLLIFTFGIISCSDLKDDIAAAPEVTTHGEGVFNSTSSEYHGKLVKESENSFEDCKQCHAADFSGGITEVSCVSSGCHPTLNVHQDGITDTESSNFHGKYIADNLSGDMSACASCHGDSYGGGVASPTCTNCHSTIAVHKDGITNPSSDNFHGTYIATNLTWDMRACGSCHSSDYSGGLAATSCLTCHTNTNGPEACNTCHGSFSDPSQIAPPRALDGSTSTTYAGVGAHTSHLAENELGSDIRCSNCHKYPTSVYADGHLGSDGKAEIIFGKLAVTGGASPTYSFTDNTCSNTYCHGNFTFYRDSSTSGRRFVYTGESMKGNNVSVKWTQVDNTQAECGSCHGLPPEGHVEYALTNCVFCHPSVVDGNGNIIDQTKHINGEINVFGN